MKVPDRAQAGGQAASFALPQISVAQWILIAILAAALFTRFWRLDVPGEFIFDEVYFPKTGQEILHGDPHAWAFYGPENTHPPLSKLFMAGGLLLFGAKGCGRRRS